jgi:hypothetical protein
MFDISKISINAKVVVLLLLIIFAFATVNPYATILSILPIPFFFLLQRKGEFPVLLIAVVYQWVAITIKVWYFDFRGIDFEDYNLFPEKIYEALTLSVVGLIAFILGIWLIIRKVTVKGQQDEVDFVSFIDIPKLLSLYAVYSVIVTLIGSSFLSYGGLAQAVSALMQFKWCLYLLLFLVVFASGNSQYKLLLALIILGEVVLGFASYFSSFKEILFFTFIGLLASYKNITLPKVMLLVFFALLVFRLGIVWTAIKSEYRMFLSGGERQQTVTVSRGEALNKFFDLAANLPDETFDVAEFALVSRISYIDYFSGAISYVPNVVPHENGQVWLNAVTHIIKPRLFFPEKEAIDDSKHLTKYTGLVVATGEQGASFSLGYMGDSYVDFGAMYMWVPIFLLGMVVGLIYRYFITHGYSLVWRLVLITPLFYFAGTYEMSSIKLFGRLMTYFLAFYLLNKYALPVLDKYIRKTSVTSIAA